MRSTKTSEPASLLLHYSSNGVLF